jgi:hypothetical protein
VKWATNQLADGFCNVGAGEMIWSRLEAGGWRAEDRVGQNGSRILISDPKLLS